MDGRRYAVGVDVGGTKIAAAVVDSEGEVHGRMRLRTERHDRDRAVEQVAEAAREAVSSAGIPWDRIAAVGIDVPGISYPASGEVWAPNLPGWDHIPLHMWLEGRLPVPVVVDSDRSAYVLGEQWMGAARGLRDVIFVAVGTGIGAGIISGGRLCRGAQGIAGAVGWFALNPDYRDEYRQAGCWEAEAAGPALARRMGVEKAEAVIESARREDPAARRAIEETIRYLGMGIANLISVLNPEMVVLGGGLMQAGEVFLEPVRREVERWAQPLAAAEARIELTELGEDAGLLGAARLALEAGIGA
jgi:glucokinase